MAKKQTASRLGIQILCRHRSRRARQQRRRSTRRRRAWNLLRHRRHGWSRRRRAGRPHRQGTPARTPEPRHRLAPTANPRSHHAGQQRHLRGRRKASRLERHGLRSHRGPGLVADCHHRPRRRFPPLQDLHAVPGEINSRRSPATIHPSANWKTASNSPKPRPWLIRAATKSFATSGRRSTIRTTRTSSTSTKCPPSQIAAF